MGTESRPIISIPTADQSYPQESKWGDPLSLEGRYLYQG